VSGQDINLELVERKQVRKGLNKFRNEGQIPAVIHNPGKDSIIVSGNYIDVAKVYHKAGKHHPVDLKVGSKSYLTIIKDVDFEPKKHTLRHVVFGIVKQDEKVETEVPIVITGDAPAQKAGLLVIKQLDHVELEALPRDLPDEVTVGSEKLIEIGDRITVADINPISNVTILTEPEHSIATVEETPAQESIEAEEAEEAEGEEGAAEGEEGAAEGEEEAEEDNKPEENKE
jgi:large subunit ribosomal protein L25